MSAYREGHWALQHTQGHVLLGSLVAISPFMSKTKIAAQYMGIPECTLRSPQHKTNHNLQTGRSVLSIILTTLLGAPVTSASSTQCGKAMKKQ